MTKREGRGLLTGEKESGMLTCGGGGAALQNSFKTSPHDIFCLWIGVVWQKNKKKTSFAVISSSTSLTPYPQKCQSCGCQQTSHQQLSLSLSKTEGLCE